MQTAISFNTIRVRVGFSREKTCRSSRVLLLLGCILILSAADLLLTVIHLQHFGLAEANPIVIFLVQSFQSLWVLAAFKLATVTLCLGFLFRARHHVAGEYGAWVATIILTIVLLVWQDYSDTVEELYIQGFTQTDYVDQMLTLTPDSDEE